MTVHSGEGETGILRCFGQQLRLLRTNRGLTRAELGAKLGYGEDMIASVEVGRRIPRPELIDRADSVLEAGGLLTVMKEEVARARYPAFFRDAAKLEAEAVELHVYANQAVPGLLQTEEYARAVFGVLRPPLDDDVVDERVTARLARQQIFHRKPPPLMSFVIDESVLRRPLGGPDVLRGQLEQVLLVGRMRYVEVQIMPLDREDNAGMAGPFTLIETREERRIAYVEVQNVSRVHSDREPVRALEAKYGTLRAQALTPRESLAYVEKLLGEL
ncbi:helix-turn-helix transcriptional regulator [Streptomyces sp. MJP52]|uniref:helix-turn-helix domain-containing protein n=1 Tax=Streptomyces sp. MJP52 TaxID=2940555 RepID=UPI0024768DEF|nr:helix-turn-helix transcriptional regulator [Streptomyces sp. MJP52]MDH6229227.1 transcriptional regulator with XRE-family HTH domain [Streptomyces sp. MJP52]